MLPRPKFFRVKGAQIFQGSQTPVGNQQQCRDMKVLLVKSGFILINLGDSRTRSFEFTAAAVCQIPDLLWARMTQITWHF